MARFQNKFEFEIYEPETQDFKVLENVEYPTQGEDYLDTTKDVSTIVIDGSRESRRIPKGTRINKYVTVVNLDTQEQTPREKIKEYIVEQDIVETVRFFDPKLYKHNMSLIETVKDTEGYQLTNLTFSYYQPYIFRIYDEDDIAYHPGRRSSKWYLEEGDLYKYGGYLGNVNKDIEYWLMNDIEFSQPKGFGVLQGNFYGQGHTLKNVSTEVFGDRGFYDIDGEKINRDNPLMETLKGFFSYIDEGAIVSDLTIEDSYLSSGKTLTTKLETGTNKETVTGLYLGVLAGYSNGLIRNCHVNNCKITYSEEQIMDDQNRSYTTPDGVPAYKDDGMIKSIGLLAGGATKIEQSSVENSSIGGYSPSGPRGTWITNEKKSSYFSYPEIPSDTPYYEVEMKQHQIYMGYLVGSIGKRKVEHNYGFKDYDYNTESFSTGSPYYISDDELNGIDGLYKVDNFLNKQSRTWIKNSYVANNEANIIIKLRSLTESDFSTGYDFPYPSCKYYIGGISGSRTNIEKSFVYNNSTNVDLIADSGSDEGAHYVELSNFMTQTDNSDYIDNLRVLNNFIDEETTLDVNIGDNVTNVDIEQSPDPLGTVKNYAGTSTINEYYPALSYASHSDFSNINEFIYDSENEDDIRNWDITSYTDERAIWILQSGDAFPTITKDTYSKIEPYKGYSLIDIIQRIIDNADYKISEIVPLIQDNIDNKNAGSIETQPKRWVISDSLKEKLLDKDTKSQNRIYKRSPEFFLRTPNVWEALLEVGAYINGIPYIENGNEINYFLLNRDEAQWENEPRKSTHSETQNGPQYASDLLSFDDNVILEDKQEDKYLSYPAPNQYITPRSENANVGRITNDNSAVVLPEDIYSIKRIRIKLDNLSDVDSKQAYDITDYVYEGKVYNTLEDTEDSKGLAIIYDQYDNTIFGFTDQPIKGYKPPLPSLQRIIEDVTGQSVPSDYQFYNVRFNVEYYPHYNTVSKAVRESDEDYEYQFTHYMQQSENKMNIELLSEYKQNRLNQLANIEEGVSYETNNWFMLPKPGEKVGEYYVNIVQWEAYPQTIRFNVAYTKDYNRISEYKDIERRKRPYPIPGQLLEDKRILFDEYLVFKSEPHYKRNTSKLTHLGLNSVFNSIAYNSEYDYKAASNCIVNCGVYNRNTELPTPEFTSRLILPVTGTVSDDGIKFDIAFDTNVSAGASSIYYGAEDIDFPLPSLTENLEYVSNNQILYGRKGFVDFISPKIISIHRNFDAYEGNYTEYPAYEDGEVLSSNMIPDYREGRVRAANQVNLLAEPYKSDIMLVDFSNLLIDIFKDAREIPKFVYEIQYVKEDKNIIVGNTLKRENPLIRHQPIDYQGVNVYLLDKKINRYQETIDTDEAVKIGSSEYNLTIDPSDIDSFSAPGIELKMEFTDSTVFQELPDGTSKAWVITDTKGNILLGKNEEMTETTDNVSTVYVQGYDNTYRIKNNLK